MGIFVAKNTDVIRGENSQIISYFARIISFLESELPHPFQAMGRNRSTV